MMIAGPSCEDPLPIYCALRSQHGQARQVRRCREQAEVGSHLHSAAHSRPPATVFPAHEVGELSFDLRACRPVVLLPCGLGLTSASSGDRGFAGTDADRPPTARLGALVAQGTTGAGVAEARQAATAGMTTDLHSHPCGAGDGVVIEVHLEAVLGEQAAGGGGALGLAARVDIGVFEALLELTGAIGVVAIDSRALTISFTFAGVVRWVGFEQVRDELFGDGGICGVAGGDRSGGDDLGVGVEEIGRASCRERVYGPV